jgi:predicted DNA-binding protein with PD1-like motif
MKIKKFDTYYVVRLEKGDEIIDALKQAASNKTIKSGFFFGLGVGKDLTLGYFDAHNKYYIKKTFAGEYEFTGFSGNISKFGEETIIHCHVTITDSNFSAFGGHLFEGTVPATCEIIILPFAAALKRKKDETTGLNVLDI